MNKNELEKIVNSNVINEYFTDKMYLDILPLLQLEDYYGKKHEFFKTDEIHDLQRDIETLFYIHISNFGSINSFDVLPSYRTKLKVMTEEGGDGYLVVRLGDHNNHKPSDKIVGSCCFRQTQMYVSGHNNNNKSTYISYICVDKDIRRTIDSNIQHNDISHIGGIGSMLISGCKKVSSVLNRHEINLHCIEGNTAKEFYYKVGMAPLYSSWNNGATCFTTTTDADIEKCAMFLSKLMLYCNVNHKQNILEGFGEIYKNQEFDKLTIKTQTLDGKEIVKFSYNDVKNMCNQLVPTQTGQIVKSENVTLLKMMMDLGNIKLPADDALSVYSKVIDECITLKKENKSTQYMGKRAISKKHIINPDIHFKAFGGDITEQELNRMSVISNVTHKLYYSYNFYKDKE